MFQSSKGPICRWRGHICPRKKRLKDLAIRWMLLRIYVCVCETEEGNTHDLLYPKKSYPVTLDIQVGTFHLFDCWAPIRRTVLLLCYQPACFGAGNQILGHKSKHGHMVGVDAGARVVKWHFDRVIRIRIQWGRMSIAALTRPYPDPALPTSPTPRRLEARFE